MVASSGNSNIGKRIKTIRLNMRITQEELAARLGISPQHISAIELDRRSPSVTFVSRLAEHLKVTTDYLITGKHPVTSDPISAITSDDRISQEAKNALIVMIRISRQANSGK